MSRLNKLAALFAVLFAIPLALAAAAFACTNLATIETSAPAGPTGSTVAVTGASFAATGNPVVLHWNGAAGPELATVAPSPIGDIATSVVVPKADPGFYVIVATQTGADGQPVYGTPARSSFEVIGADGRGAPAQPAAPLQPGRPVSAHSSNGVLLFTSAIGLGGLALFGAGLTTLVRHARRRQVAVPVRHD